MDRDTKRMLIARNLAARERHEKDKLKDDNKVLKEENEKLKKEKTNGNDI